VRAQGVEPICLRWEDTDGDGEAEWVGLYQQAKEPPQLAAFILDGETWYDLRPLEKEEYGLGEYATCELDIRDINADGRVEILVWGHAGANIDLLHVFAWDGATYALLAPFQGNAGVRLESTGEGLANSVVVGRKVSGDLAWEVVYTWDGAGYGWTWDRYTWFYLDRPHAYVSGTPERAVISFYLALGDRDLPGAYNLLTDAAREAQLYEQWTAGFARTIDVEAGAVQELERQGQDVAHVTAQVRAHDNVSGRVFAILWDVEWTVVRTPDGWRLDSAKVTELDRWEVEYYR